MRVKIKCPACGAAQSVGPATPEATCPRCGGVSLLAWTAAVGEDREVDACPACEGRDFYVRKDLNRTLGLVTVVVVGLISVGFLWAGREGLAYGILFAFALVDLVAYALLKLVTVCYRCQAEFRGAYRRTASGFDLHQAERLELEYSRTLETGRTGPGVRSADSPPR
jgi:hypothetical protein